jgi:hypothetical protein
MPTIRYRATVRDKQQTVHQFMVRRDAKPWSRWTVVSCGGAESVH